MPARSRPTPRTPVRAMVLAAAVSLLLTACSSGERAEVPEVPVGEHQGPLMERLAPVVLALSGEEATIALNVAMQETIASCMAESGFEYIPYVAPTRVSAPVTDAGTRDWVARRGYDLSGGVAEGPGLETLASADSSTASAPVDPNVALYAALSPGTRDAYDLALSGPGFTEEDLTGETAREWTRADGCILWSSTQDVDQGTAYLDDYTDLMDRITIAERSVDSHPRMAELTISWAHCMADAGHIYSSPTQAFEAVYAAIRDDPGLDGRALVTSEEVRAFEIAVALADFDCKEELGWDDVRNGVVDEVEGQFLADNEAEIDEFIGAVLERQP